MNVDAVNDAPVLTKNDADPLTYTEDSPSENHDAPVMPNLGVADGDDPSLAGATVQFTAGFTAAEDALVFGDQNGITGNYNPGTGVLTLTGSSSVANYETALRSVAYENDSDNPNVYPAHRQLRGHRRAHRREPAQQHRQPEHRRRRDERRSDRR